MTKKWKVVLLVFFSLLLGLITIGALVRMNTKKHSPQDIITFNEAGLFMKSVYCQPYKKGRVIFGIAADGAIQPYGEYWRMGANDATTFEVEQDVLFAGKPLKAGKYCLYAIPGEKSWEIRVNSDYNRWGTPGPDPADDVLMVELPVNYTDTIEEQFTMAFIAADNGADLVLKWDKIMLKIPIQLAK